MAAFQYKAFDGGGQVIGRFLGALRVQERQLREGEERASADRVSGDIDVECGQGFLGLVFV